MTEAKHTPGPWKIHRGKHNSCYLAIIDSIPDQDGKVVANCICHVAMTNDDRTANAIAIAALPDLLAACEMVLPGIEIQERLQGCEFADGRALRAAIAKAKEATK